MSRVLTRRGALGLGLTLSASLVREAHAAGPELAVIVNPRNSQLLSAIELEAIFRSTRRYWQSGAPIMAFNLAPSSPERVTFDRAVLKLSPEEVARFWIDRRIRGGEPPPRSVPSASLLVRLVAQAATSIGYVPVSELTSGVRPVAWVRKGVLTTAMIPPFSLHPEWLG